MRRRTFLLSLLGAPLIAASDDRTAIREVKDAAVAVGEQFNVWVAAWNKGPSRTGTLDVAEVEAFEPLPKLFRKWESARRDWVKGFRR